MVKIGSFCVIKVSLPIGIKLLLFRNNAVDHVVWATQCYAGAWWGGENEIPQDKD